jgi:stearoyl-CoA desaturase (delta-9 desaturase)
MEMIPILVFFVLHWQLSVFSQSFFLHRYGAHRQFTMSKGWERFFHLFTLFMQGSSYLNARGYAILHRMHHAYSDTPKDPHSPENHKNVFTMMWDTAKIYSGFAHDREKPEPRFDGGMPDWPLLEKIGDSWGARLAFGTAYTLFYIAFAPHWAFYFLIPVHYMMGPIHGAIVNWCGHRYGYRNFASTDVSKNTLVFDVLTAGELFQNNHHKYGQSPNFAARWFEIDPTYQVMKVLAALKIIDMSKSQTMRWKKEDKILPIEIEPAPGE